MLQKSNVNQKTALFSPKECGFKQTDQTNETNIYCRFKLNIDLLFNGNQFSI